MSPSSLPCHRRRPAPALALLASLGVALLASAAAAQPFTTWVSFAGDPSSGFVNIPHNSALNPTGAFTFEAWVAIANNVAGEDCRSIAGKNYLQAWWLGQCNVGGQPTLRSYLKGGASLRQGGIIPRNVWTHVAVTFDGSNRRHYINGEVAATFPEAGPLPTSLSDMRLGSDVSWQHTPAGNIDEVRLWNVARTTSQLRSNLNVRIASAQPGLIAVWSLDGNANDIIGARDGATGGAGVGFLTFPVATGCAVTTPTLLCLDGRFTVNTFWRTNPTPGTPTDGAGQVVGFQENNSGIFWFFSATNWEVMVKVLDGCGLNNRYWVFFAATTNVHYRLEVTDIPAGERKIYFNYPGPPAPAVTDTNALATCP